MKIKIKVPKPRNPIAKALQSRLYGKRIVALKTVYNRKKDSWRDR